MDLLDNKEKIIKPENLTKEFHSQLLEIFRVNLKEFQLQKSQYQNFSQMRVRNWLFLYENGESVVDIILDKGYCSKQVEAQLVPRQANTNLTFNECIEFHNFLLSTKAFDFFTDDVQVRVGSPGHEPSLHDLEDFEASIGEMLQVETWTKHSKKNNYTLVLSEVCSNKDLKVIVLVEGSKKIEIPFEDIKTAFAMPFHPASCSAQKAKQAARRKARQTAIDKYKKQ